MKINTLIVFMLSCLLLFSCNKRPKMAYDQKDKGAIQDIEAFNVEASAENFRKESTEFKEKKIKILQKNSKVEMGSRRVSLEKRKSEQLSIIDHNLPIKNLEDDLVTFKFNDIDLKSALKLFASTVKRNIIIGNEVQGNLVMDFEDIQWGSAVYAVLDMNNLVMTEDKQSGLLRVHTSKQFKILAESKIEQTKAINASLASLGSDSIGSDNENEVNKISEIFKIFYQTSADVIAPLTAAVGENVTITDDPKNNQLIVTASLKDLNKVDSTLDELDVEKKQVMIEAYIINATDNFTKAFNANLNAYNIEEQNGEENRITMVGIDTNPSTSTKFTAADAASGDTAVSNVNMNTIATDSGSTVAGGAFLLGNLGITKLKAIITASNTDNNAETISNPKLFAMDGESSTLVQGVKLLKVIPGSGDAAGTTKEVDQNLNLTLTPRVIGDKKIKIKLEISNDSPGESSGEDVATNKESIASTVQLETGDVAILGGVYTNKRTDNKQYVPFLSSIPIIGSFFKQKSKSDGKTQLLIFLTANIV